jgi:hypothetical protein
LLHYVTKMGHDTVRIDSELLEEIEQLLCKEKNRCCRLSSAQFVNNAVKEYLGKVKKNGGKLVLNLK